MYKPPQNTNRVQSLKNKFENLEKNKTDNIGNGCGNNLNKYLEKAIQNRKTDLQIQVSEPLKRNIKRTPAFRVDRSFSENSGLPKKCSNPSILLKDRLKQYGAGKNNCDNSLNNCNKHDTTVNEESEITTHHKFNSSHDLQAVGEKFDNPPEQGEIKCAQQINFSACDTQNCVDKTLPMLYTEPIPKALRNKNVTKQTVIEQSCDVYNISSLSCNEFTGKTENITSSKLLTDTLKVALKKPLPAGPAPKKPPRTFQHVQNNCDMKKNNSFLHLMNSSDRGGHTRPRSVHKKTDPKYMLNKLENALRNNRLHAKQQYKNDICTTSGEDSDDSLLSKSKFNKLRPKLSSESSDSVNTSTFNFNCLGIMNCSRSEYEKINEPSSSFFVDNINEPIYVEPYHFLQDGTRGVIKDRKSL